MNDKLKIGIIVGSTREGRVGKQVGEWVLSESKRLGKDEYQLIDVKSFNLPLLGEANAEQEVALWRKTINELDGFIFVVAEYNHAMTASLKNALDLASVEWNNKAAGLVSYGSAYGARAAEQVRLVLGELQVADVRTQVLLSLFMDFKDGKFNPQSIHEKNMEEMLNQLSRWTGALKSLR